MEWIDDLAPDPVPDSLLDRIMYLGTPTTGREGTHLPITEDGPQAHLAIQGSATTELGTHFHGVDQFQLFVRGSGTIGRHAMHAGIVHYSDRHTVYGPLRPGPNGMVYATLRVRHDPGAHFMPESRRTLTGLLSTSARPASERRNVTIDLCSSTDDANTGVKGWHDFLADPDGLRVAIHQVDSGERTAPVDIIGAGAYMAVVVGAVDDGGKPRVAGAITWRDSGTSFDAVAVVPGTRIALLQFPTLPAGPGRHPAVLEPTGYLERRSPIRPAATG